MNFFGFGEGKKEEYKGRENAGGKSEAIPPEAAEGLGANVHESVGPDAEAAGLRKSLNELREIPNPSRDELEQMRNLEIKIGYLEESAKRLSQN